MKILHLEEVLLSLGACRSGEGEGRGKKRKKERGEKDAREGGGEGTPRRVVDAEDGYGSRRGVG